MLNKSLIILIVLLLGRNINKDPWQWFVIWNVGQGSWFSHITDQYCHHIDAGGDFIAKTKIISMCGHKLNIFSFTHWDSDHVSLFLKHHKLFPRACVLHLPFGETKSKKKLKLRTLKKPCGIITTLTKEVDFNRSLLKSNNDRSRVFVSDFILNPGDTGRKSEKVWLKKINPRKIKALILGHHGSKTSTSKELLNHLDHLNYAISSSRKKRYGHPHWSVVNRLKKYKIPHLSTEKWGHIFIRRE